ncbi:MAG TPA: hypothetical protein VMU84_16145, partial [Thermoanaerobaculia bacterium]|nr:hypothetical protein [Thermoanaerobaculia bacterium]
LVAMPLAVAAVADLADVPRDDLFSLVATLNQADVPPTEFVQVIRYVPVALVVEDTQPDFVTFVRTQTDQGIRGPALVTVIERRLQTFNVQPDFRTDRVVVVNQDFIPPIVRTRIREVHEHPHGGPPGQLKKQLGLQTGAEVVHGERPSHPREVVVVTKPAREHGRGHEGGPPGQMKHGGGHGKGKGKGKG